MMRWGFALYIGLGALPGAGAAASERVILSLNIADGSMAAGGVVRDAAGNLYGLATYGGIYNGGTLYELPARGPARVLHEFQIFATDSPPWQPYGELLLGRGGVLYGTAALGGTHTCGAVYKLVPGVAFSVVYNFRCGIDGGNPAAGLIADPAGNLYGTAENYGGHAGGTVFRIAPDGTFSVLADLGRGKDAANPQAALTRDQAGNLYGTTFGGGAAGAGAVFRITAAGTESVVYSFSGGADGANPSAPVTLGPDGSIYGTTFQGGTDGFGVVFKISPSGTETVLHSFTLTGEDGGFPNGALLLDAKGNLTGTTENGGRGGAGTLFRLAPDGRETLISDFPGKYNAAGPIGALARDPAGDLFGVGQYGGRFANRTGAVFEISHATH